MPVDQIEAMFGLAETAVSDIAPYDIVEHAKKLIELYGPVTKRVYPE